MLNGPTSSGVLAKPRAQPLEPPVVEVRVPLAAGYQMGPASE